MPLGPPAAADDRTLRLDADPAGIAAAAEILRAGKLVAFPTETVYGLGADARSDDAVARIYAAKDRPRFNPLIAHVPSLAAARREGLFDRNAEALATAFWPGPLTLVMPARPETSVSALARAGLPSIALRVPDHPIARALLEAAAFPVAAPSANRSGRVSPTDASHVAAELDGRIAALILGGPTSVGLESTVVSCLGEPRLLRPGGITRAALEAVLGRPFALGGPAAGLVAPGMLSSHYAPRAALRLNAVELAPDEAGLDFGARLRPGAGPYLDLSPRRDLVQAAANLFAYLRRLDAGADAIAVAPVPDAGLGEAINDRLTRAAGPRP